MKKQQIPEIPDSYIRILSRERDAEFEFEKWGPEKFSEWQEKFRAELTLALGLPRIARRVDSDHRPESEKLAEKEKKDHIREEWTLESEPDFSFTFYVLRPKEIKQPCPVVLTPHGHGRFSKDTYAGIIHDAEHEKSIKEGERDIAYQAVKQGYIALAPEVRAFGGTRLQEDIQEDNLSSCSKLAMRALMFDRTLLGERVWDIQRLIDYAETRPQMDTDRIVISGNSGGGTVSLFSSAVDTRISIAVPSCYFCTFEDSIGSIRHCECNYVPGIMNLGEMYDVAGLIAPRPFLAVAGRDDSIFPLEGVKKSFARLQEIYRAVGAGERCELFVGEGGHRYYKERVWSFVEQWLA